MHLLMITGFLGSGKTTLVIQLAQEAIRQGRRVAILVNEIGEIGIDDQLMKQLDLNVWEMVNGCICCTLAADLVTTLHQLDAAYDVDLALLEPSGAAEPNNILQTLPYYKGRPLESIRSVAVLDPLRLPELYEVLTPLITKQLAHSELLLVTKADLASDDQLAATRQVAALTNPDAPLRVVSTRAPLSADLLAELLPWTS